jgi:hypothetical protein
MSTNAAQRPNEEPCASQKDYKSECDIASRDDLCYCYKKWELRLHSAGVAGTATEHCHAYAISLFVDLVILNERARGEVTKIPAMALDVFSDMAGSEWDCMISVSKRVSCRDKCIPSLSLVVAVCYHTLEARTCVSVFEFSLLQWRNLASLVRSNDPHPYNRATFNTSPQRNTAGADAGDLFGTYELS